MKPHFNPSIVFIEVMYICALVRISAASVSTNFQLDLLIVLMVWCLFVFYFNPIFVFLKKCNLHVSNKMKNKEEIPQGRNSSKIHIMSYYKVFLYFNLCLSVMLDSISGLFTSISLLTNYFNIRI